MAPNKGLALSGGGYRASLFHLGALTRLHELGLLGQLTRISSVSGGSIVAGHLAHAMLEHGIDGTLRFSDWEAEVARPFRRFVDRDARTGPFLKYLFWGQLKPTLRINALRDDLEARLTSRLLRELPTGGDSTEFVFLATDMKYGTAWRFEPRRMFTYRDEQGDQFDVGDTSIATAVAASACFPPLFGPMDVPVREDERVRLTDGGVYDNSGMEPVWKDEGLVLVSDAGKPFSTKIPRTYVGKAMRYANIATEQVRAQRQRHLIGRFITAKRLGRNFEGALWRLSSSKENFVDGASPEFMAFYAEQSKTWYGYDDTPGGVASTHIQRVRTDLDRFIDRECKVLENHGYFFADLAIRRHLSANYPISAPFAVPHPELAGEKQARRALRNSHSLLAFWRRR